MSSELSPEQLKELKAHQDELLTSLWLERAPGAPAPAPALALAPAELAAPSWSFAQGLLLGQLSVFVVLVIFIKFFVFAEQSAVTSSKASGAKVSARSSSGVIVRRNAKKKGRGRRAADAADSDASDDDTPADARTVAAILEKTYYDVANHTPESLDWFNVLIAQMISQLRGEALGGDNIYHLLNDFLAMLHLPDYVDTIRLTEIDVGDDFPIFLNCRIRHSADGLGRLEAKIDVDLSDTLTLGIDTKLLLNYPIPLTAVLPVQLLVSIVRFLGCLTVSLINTEVAAAPVLAALPRAAAPVAPSTAAEAPTPPSTPPLATPPAAAAASGPPGASASASPPGGTALMFLFSPDYRLEFSIKLLIGSRAKLQDVPKISALVESKLRSWFTERCIEPRYQVVKLPSLWPRSKNTREPATE